MPRFFIPPEQIQGRRFSLSGSEAHHALHVLRKKVGDVLELFDGRDASYTGRVEAIVDERIEGTLLNSISPARKSLKGIRLTLVQSLIKGPKFDWLVEKAAEVGVSSLWPIAAARSVVKIVSGSAEEKTGRWKRIALEASKQCGRTDVMAIEPPVTLLEALSKLPSGALALIPWEKETKQSIRDACRGFGGQDVFLFIGPEGGWENQEIEAARKAKVVPVRLGPTLLRSETAGLVSAALVFGELGPYV